MWKYENVKNVEMKYNSFPHFHIYTFPHLSLQHEKKKGLEMDKGHPRYLCTRRRRDLFLPGPAFLSSG